MYFGRTTGRSLAEVGEKMSAFLREEEKRIAPAKGTMAGTTQAQHDFKLLN